MRVDFVWVDRFIGERRIKGKGKVEVMNIVDSDNRMKAPLDMVFGAIGLDDTLAKHLSIRCIHSSKTKDFVMNISKPKPLDRLEGEE